MATKCSDTAAFFAAVKQNDLQRVRELLDADPNLVHATDGDAMTGLLHTAKDDRLAMAALLIDRGADLEAVDAEYGDTALGWTVFYGQVRAAESLIARGANVKHRLKGGGSILSLALDGERGQWRQWSDATPEQYRAVADLLRRHGATP